MKRALIVSAVAAIACICLMSFRHPAVELSECFTVIKAEWGGHCGSQDSYEVKWRNDCNETLDIKHAIQRANGTWDAGQNSNTRPGDVVVGAWTCHSTGKYKWWVRRSSEWNTVKFPSQAEIDAN